MTCMNRTAFAGREPGVFGSRCERFRSSSLAARSSVRWTILCIGAWQRIAAEQTQEPVKSRQVRIGAWPTQPLIAYSATQATVMVSMVPLGCAEAWFWDCRVRSMGMVGH